MCLKKPPRDLKKAMRLAMLKEMDLFGKDGEAKEDDRDSESESEDEFKVLGFGINAYFDIILSLTKMCLCITLFCIPLFIIYGKGDYFEYES